VNDTFTQADIDGGLLTYDHDGSNTSSDSFQFSLADGGEDGATPASGSFNITINPANSAPQAVSDGYDLAQATPLVVLPGGVLANDSDPDGDTMTAELVQGPQHGVLLLNADGSFSYMPDMSFSGIDQFQYRVFDGTTYSAPVTVELRVQAVAPPPPPSGEGEGDSEGEGEGDGDSQGEENQDSNSENTKPDQASDAMQADPMIAAAGGSNGSAAASSRAVVTESSATQSSGGAAASKGGVASVDRLVTEFSGQRVRGSAMMPDPVSDSAAYMALEQQLATKELVATLEGMQRRAGVDAGSSPTTFTLPSVAVGTTAIVSTTFSIGYAIWIARGGSLLLTFMSSLPAWASFDPLPIVESFQESDGKRKEEESLSSIVEKGTKS